MNLITNLFNTLLTYPIFNALMELYHLLGDLGLSIVTLTAIVFLATFPFTWKQLTTTKAIQALQPQLVELKRRHANNPMDRAEAEQALYKDQGISLSSSFGPLLIQSAVLSGLFFALNSVLRNSTLSTINRIMYPFLAHFSTMPDLNLTWFTVFDALWHISLGYPDPTHILPLLTGLLTFMQMRMAHPITQASQTIMQATQAMQFIMLLFSVAITIYFAWQFAAGVALYRLVWLALSMIQRYFVTGWGSLWIMPGLATSGPGNASGSRRDVGTQQTLLPPNKTRRRHGSGSSARRRGRKPKRK
jgi:YidC/Oxa1 family membrane protein insertase